MEIQIQNFWQQPGLVIAGVAIVTAAVSFFVISLISLFRRGGR